MLYLVIEHFNGDPALLEAWMDRWRDLVTFEVLPVLTSAEAAARVAPRL